MSSAHEILVVGLGPGSPDLLTRETVAALRSSRVFLRTHIHPTLAYLPESAGWRSFDRLYDEAPDFSALYDRMVDTLLAKSRQGPLVYAVPGSPLFAEASVRHLRRRAALEGVPVRVLPAVSFIDVVAGALDLDPVAGNIQLVDALDLAAYSEREPFAGGSLPLSNLRPALVAQLYSKPIASAAKLALLTVYPPDLQIALVTAAGTPEQAIARRALSELDHGPVDHLSTLYLPTVEPLVWPRSPEAVRQITSRLRAPGGCPWDREQT
ncbi:MAG TPA: SAM-dependent methyltransferase, partial [Nitrolancea sp.]|nr:SAM-dependent methyltransferase [Nitrolancea sp.]